MSLSVEEVAIIKSTVPLLESGGVALTTHFYNSMFAAESPVRSFFNQSHQQGEHSQPRALAFSVLCVAKHIDALPAMLASEEGSQLIQTIVQKHLAVQVAPEHYPIVGKYLLQSMREVLGEEIATDAVLAAWGKTYGVVADLLINAEKQGYQAIAETPGGWRGKREFVISQVEYENAAKNVVSLYLKPADGLPILVPKAGQYLTLRIDDAGANINTTRNYSISDVVAPIGDEQSYRITVKFGEKGTVSRYLSNNAQVGFKLQVHPPCGEFTLKRDYAVNADGIKRVVFLAAGSGITPLISMMKQLRSQNAAIEIVLVQISHNEEQQIYPQLAQEVLTPNNIKFENVYTQNRPLHEQDVQVPSAAYLDLLKTQLVAPAVPVDFYFLGPREFMRNTNTALNDIQFTGGVFYEFFGPHIFFNTKL